MSMMPTPEYRFSIIIPIYNTEEYLPDVFKTLERQNKGFSNLEVICVNDGSTDSSGEVVKEWEKKYPTSIIYFEQENSGVAAARNLGLKHATGDWITFIDSDDFISKNYFESIENLIQHKRSSNLGLIVTYRMIYDQRSQKPRDTHPLKYSFTKGYNWIDASHPGNFLVNTMTNCVFRKDILKQNFITVKEDIFPNYEDAEFTAQYLLKIQSKDIGTAPSARYYVRKRSDASSLTDNARNKASYYTCTLINGCLRTIEKVHEEIGYVPRFLQRMILHEILSAIHFLLKTKLDLETLGNGLTAKTYKTLLKIFTYVDVSTIQKFKTPFSRKLGILHSFKQVKSSILYIDIVDFDSTIDEIKITHFSNSPEVQISFNNTIDSIEPRIHKITEESLLGLPFIYKHIFWIPCETDELNIVSTSLDISVILHCKKVICPNTVKITEIKKLLAVKPLPNIPLKIRLLQKIAFLPFFRRKFKDAWLFIDNDIMADDNASYLYRYVKESQSQINSYFILRSISPDWSKRKKEGFRLINYRSWLWFIAMANCKVLVCSYTEPYLIELPRYWRHLQKYKYIYVQHGIFKNDMSTWINTVPFTMITVTTNAEYHSMVDNFTRYTATPKEVALTGLPRQDPLLASDNTPEKTILIMPTWRNYLTGPKQLGLHQRKYNPAMENSVFHLAWQSFMRSEKLKEMVEKYHYNVVFFPHLHIQQYMPLFDIPDFIEKHTQETISSLNDLFKSSTIFITDYSSAAFEWALMRRSILYYHFDHEEYFQHANGASVQGYYDYERDGFGPVAYTETSLLNFLEFSLKNNGEPSSSYLKRINNTFPYYDQKNSERVFNAILERIEPTSSN